MVLVAQTKSAEDKAAKDREKREEELKELQRANADRWHYSRVPSEVHTDVVVDDGLDDDGEPKVKKVGEVHAFGGKVYVDVSGEFSRDDVFVLSQLIQKAFQAVA